VDDLEGLGSYAREHDLWFHVDGAYGGAALFSPTERHLLAGLRHADSFIVDPHKWLFGPLDCCALIYRNPTVARKVLANRPATSTSCTRATTSTTSGTRRTSRSTCRAEPWSPLLVLARHQRHGGLRERRAERGRHRHRTQQKIAALDYVEMVRPISLSIVLFRRKGWTSEQYTEWSINSCVIKSPS